jgi:hypothetical protein
MCHMTLHEQVMRRAVLGAFVLITSGRGKFAR